MRQQNLLLAAVYLYGYSVEMCLTAAYFRNAGFRSTDIIGRAVREEHMKEAQKARHPDGRPLMTTDPHPLVGWARLLESRRADPTEPERNRLREAVGKAELVYRHWRPELRYKMTNVSTDQVNEVRQCVRWFITQRGRL